MHVLNCNVSDTFFYSYWNFHLKKIYKVKYKVNWIESNRYNKGFWGSGVWVWGALSEQTLAAFDRIWSWCLNESTFDATLVQCGDHCWAYFSIKCALLELETVPSIDHTVIVQTLAVQQTICRNCFKVMTYETSEGRYLH